MKYTLPQEIQVWYILPVIRRELSKILVKEKGLTQKETAKKLSLTEGAVSQYLSSKRGNAIKFNEEILQELRVSAEIINKEPKNILKEMIRLLNLKVMWKIVCDYHKQNDHLVDGKCDICTLYKNINCDCR